MLHFLKTDLLSLSVIPIRILRKFVLSVDTVLAHLGLVLLGACLPVCTGDFARK